MARVPRSPPRRLDRPKRPERLLERLGHGHLVTGDGRQRGRAGEHGLELVEANLVGGDLQQAILGNVQLHAAGSQRPPDDLHVRD